jgi:hypothetical protein
MVAAHDMVGTEGRYAKAIPHDELVKWIQYYRRYTPPQ